MAQNLLNESNVIAPINGTVQTLNLREGDTVSAGGLMSSVPIYLIDFSALHITAQVDEVDIARVHSGQEAIVSFDAMPEQEYQGEVTAISRIPAANPQTSGLVVYEVEIKLDNPPEFIRPGLSATVDIITDRRTEALLLLSRAIQEDDAGKTVVEIPVKNGSEFRAVETGISDGVNTEITGGLNEGDVVIITRASESLGIFGQ